MPRLPGCPVAPRRGTRVVGTVSARPPSFQRGYDKKPPLSVFRCSLGVFVLLGNVVLLRRAPRARKAASKRESRENGERSSSALRAESSPAIVLYKPVYKRVSRDSN